MTTTQTHKTYRGLVLDPFQQEALAYIDNNDSVLVAAPTGVGKTLIADYVIEKIYRDHGRVIYTAPIKALSNQKFKEFKAHIGEEAVGILTGDLVINPDARILIMTTEIFRNLLQQDPERVDDVRYVIFDEIHYIDDPQRGSVWEESLIFMPAQMRFLGLSATIPNVDQLADWISTIQNQNIQVVTHFERVVPLRHYLFERNAGIVTLKKLQKLFRRLVKQEKEKPPWQRGGFQPTSHLHLIDEIKEEYLPCLFFTFSRRKCEVNATELGATHDFLSAEQKEQALAIVAQVADRYPQISTQRWENLRQLVLRGIGYHHAGMLPALKDVVEELFTHRLLPVLYCTETFAVGLNFPCRSVCFESPTKWDGVAFRALSNREYFQMAGRAGRRGIDTEGYAFTLVNLNYFDPREFPSMKEQQIEPLKSQFSLSYNSVLNLVNNYDEPNIYRILGKNFASFQAYEEKRVLQKQRARLKQELQDYHPKTRMHKKLTARYQRLVKKEKRLDPQRQYVEQFQDRKALLTALGYIEDDKLTVSGQFASQIHGQELLVTEMFMEGLLHKYSIPELTGILVAVGYEPRKNEDRVRHRINTSPIKKIIMRIASMEDHFLGYPTVQFNDHILALAYRWSNGEKFSSIIEDSPVDEGDIVFAFRRGIDIMRQIRNASLEDPILSTKMRECIAQMDRDEVSIWL